MFTVCHKVISLAYNLFQYIIRDGILLSWTGPCGLMVFLKAILKKLISNIRYQQMTKNSCNITQHAMNKQRKKSTIVSCQGQDIANIYHTEKETEIQSDIPDFKKVDNF